MGIKWLVAVGAAVLVTCAATSVFAQQDGATIVGEVTDPSGGLVPGATVTVTNSATGITLSPAH